MKQPSTPNKKRFGLIPVLLIAAGVIVLLGAGGFAFAATQESHDPFCASCHTQPESTFVQRSTSTPVDLASYHAALHAAQQTRCIDCHSGQGVLGRMQAELMGAGNAFKWYTGTAVQPAVLLYPISNDSCLKCHQDIVNRGFTAKAAITIPGASAAGGGRREAGRPNHWHEFLTRWQAADANAATCVTCHSGHAATSGAVTGTAATGGAQGGFMDSQTVQATCNACHQAIRRGD